MNLFTGDTVKFEVNKFVFLMFIDYDYIYIYIYIYMSSTDSLFCSISVARHAERSKPGSKPVQLYVRLSFRPLGHQADHIGLGNF